MNMKVKYPTFLSQNPTFMGLNFIDLIIVGVGLVLSLTFGMNSLFGTGLTIGLIALNKWIQKNIDLKGFLFGRSVRELDWMDSVNQEKV